MRSRRSPFPRKVLPPLALAFVAFSCAPILGFDEGEPLGEGGTAGSEPSCDNKSFDPETETDTDCGGDCRPCGLGKGCFDSNDCLEAQCVEMRCQPVENPRCGLERPLYSFDDDGELYGFSVEWTEPDNTLSDAEVVSDAELDAMVIHAAFEPTIANGRDQEIYLANRFAAAMDLRGRSVRACVRLLEDVDGTPDLPSIELFVATSDGLVSGFSSALALQRDAGWHEIRLAVDNPTRTDEEMPIFPDDARGIGFKVFTGLSGNYGPVRIAVDAIAIE